MNISGQNPEPDEIEEMVDEADADGSGSINFPEFIELMLKNMGPFYLKCLLNRPLY